MGFDFGLEGVDDLAGGVKAGGAEDVEQALVTELLLLWVLGLVQTIGVDEEGTALDGVDALALVFESGPQANGGTGNHLQEIAVTLAATDDGGIMTGIAEVEVTGGEVDESEEERDEHTALVVVARECVVHAVAYLCGHHPLFGQCEEESRGLCHEE